MPHGYVNNVILSWCFFRIGYTILSSWFLFRPDDDSGAGDIHVTFNLTNGNANNLLEPIPAVDIAPDTNISISLVARQAGHVDIVAISSDNETE